MNERDFVDWIVVSASVFSSCSLLATIYFYKREKKDNEIIKRKETQDEIALIKKTALYSINENIDIAKIKLNEFNMAKKAINDGGRNLNLSKNAQYLLPFNLSIMFYKSMRYSDELSGSIYNIMHVIKITNTRLNTYSTMYNNESTLCDYIIDEYTEAIRCLNTCKTELDSINL